MKLIPFLSMALAAGTLVLSNLAWSHGYVAFPKARQQICKDDGGYWWPADGSGIANLACRSAFQKSGGYALTQHHEYSSNVADYHQMTAVKAVIKDGTLCAGGDPRKAGMDLPSPHWQSTVIDVNSTPMLQVRFRATTPHNPSFWQFYLSNNDYDSATAPLSWDKLTLIHQQNDVPAQNGYYEIEVPLPKSRSGKAVLYTRWQRQDVVGEGFYNCSDLQLVNGSTGPAEWFDKGSYLTSGQLGQVGETALFRLFDPQGQELIQHRLVIEAGNVTGQAWALELANQVNTLHGDRVQIGLLINGAIELQSNVFANRIYLLDNHGHVNLDLKPANGGQTCGGLDPTKIFAWPNWPRQDHAGRPSYADKTDLMSEGGKVYRAKWWTQAKPGTDSSWDLVCSLPR